MSLHTTVTTLVLTLFLFLGITKKGDVLALNMLTPAFRADTLPVLNSIREEDIDSADVSLKDQTITVKCKNGGILTYGKKDWEPYAGADLNKTIKQATDWLTMTFTKAEYAPSFPGGEIEWNKYLKTYCKKNKATLKRTGDGIVHIQFTVDQHGVLNYVEPIGNPSPELGALATDALLNGPRWIPATQNGRIVICYHKLAVKLNL